MNQLRLHRVLETEQFQFENPKIANVTRVDAVEPFQYASGDESSPDHLMSTRSTATNVPNDSDIATFQSIEDGKILYAGCEIADLIHKSDVGKLRVKDDDNKKIVLSRMMHVIFEGQR